MTRSRPQNDSLLALEGRSDVPSTAELSAIADLWKRTRRTFVARFDGVSMRPTIEPQQPVTVHCGQSASVGDVILALRAGGIVVHRVIWRSRRGTWVLTRGDARTIPDLPLDAEDVAAVVDAAPYVERRTQRIASGIVSTAGKFGRIPARIAVRALQVLSWARNGGGGRM